MSDTWSKEFKEWLSDGNANGCNHATWRAWQASRESLVILLVPPHNDCENYSDSQVSGAYKYYGQAIKHIHAAGIRTK